MKSKKSKSKAISYELHIHNRFNKENVFYLKDLAEIIKFDFNVYQNTIIAKPQVYKEIKQKELVFDEKMNKIFK